MESIVNRDQQTWLETLKPETRELVEAEIALYGDEDLWEFEEVDDDDWESSPWTGEVSGLVAAD